MRGKNLSWIMTETGLCSPEQEEQNANIKPDAETMCCGYVAKLWGATSPEGAWVTIKTPSRILLNSYRLPDSDNYGSSDTELGAIKHIINVRFRDERDRLLKAEAVPA